MVPQLVPHFHGWVPVLCHALQFFLLFLLVTVIITKSDLVSVLHLKQNTTIILKYYHQNVAITQHVLVFSISHLLH